MPPLLLLLLICSSLLTSCIPALQAYYLSPRHASANHYKPIPLHSDSVKTGTYLSGMIDLGAANDRLRDGMLHAQANIHQSRRFGSFAAFYGAAFSAGNYHVNDFSGNFTGSNVDPFFLDSASGNKFFGSYGVNGGMSLAIPFSGGGEWRVIGVEASLENEFGSYLKFRKYMPEGVANVVDRNHFYPTVSVTSDFVGHLQDGSIGYRMAYTRLIGKLDGIWSPGDQFTAIPQYMTHTLHLTIHRWTGYGQLNTGSHAFHFQLGIARRLERIKPAAKPLATVF